MSTPKTLIYVRKGLLFLAAISTAFALFMFAYSAVASWSYDNYMVIIQLFTNILNFVMVVFTFAKYQPPIFKRLSLAAFLCVFLMTGAIAPMTRNIKDTAGFCKEGYHTLNPCLAQMVLSIVQLVSVPLLATESYINYKYVKAEERRVADLGLLDLADMHAPPVVHHYQPDLDSTMAATTLATTIATGPQEEESLPKYEKNTPIGRQIYIVDMSNLDPPPEHEFGPPPQHEFGRHTETNDSETFSTGTGFHRDDSNHNNTTRG
ncbi:hypothetical protein BG004_006850 [Podila humilis]|nr:hypothetical protein BG004_006850 [Podila humilis]